MSLSLLQHKIELIESTLPRDSADLLLADMAATVASDTNLSAPRAELAESVALAALYAYVRHLPWTDTPLFLELVNEFLVSGMGVSSNTCAKLNSRLSHELAAYKPRLFAEVEADSDRHFLRYIFIASATAQNEGTLVADLGLGRAVLRRIKSAASWIVSQASQPQQAEPPGFMQALDACFAETMLEFSREMRQVPWITDWYRTRYHTLMRAVADTRVIFESLGNEPVFQFLVWAINRQAQGERIEVSDLLEWDGMSQITVVSPEQFLAALTAVGLTELAHERGFKPKWRLTVLGEDLAADAWAHQYGQVASVPLPDMLRLPHRLQASLVRNLPTKRTGELHAFVQTEAARQLSPGAIEQVFRKLATALSDDQTAQLARTQLRVLTSPFARRGIVLGLQDVTSQNAVRQVIENVAVSDDSPMVRAAARVQLPAEQPRRETTRTSAAAREASETNGTAARDPL